MIRFEDGAWRATPAIADAAVPPTIHALLAARLDGLEVDERAVIEPAAVIGQIFVRAPVQHLAPERVQPELDAAPPLARREAARSHGSLADGGERVPLPPRPHPRHRLRRDPQARPSDVPRAVRRVGRQRQPRGRDRVRGDPRLPPRAGASLPLRARPAGRPRPRARCRRLPAAGCGGAPRIRARRRAGRREPARSRRARSSRRTIDGRLELLPEYGEALLQVGRLREAEAVARRGDRARREQVDATRSSPTRRWYACSSSSEPVTRRAGTTRRRSRSPRRWPSSRRPATTPGSRGPGGSSPGRTAPRCSSAWRRTLCEQRSSTPRLAGDARQQTHRRRRRTPQRPCSGRPRSRKRSSAARRCVEQVSGDRQSEARSSALLGSLYALQRLVRARTRASAPRDGDARGAPTRRARTRACASRHGGSRCSRETLAGRRTPASTTPTTGSGRRRDVPPLDGQRASRPDAVRARTATTRRSRWLARTGARDRRRRRHADAMALPPRKGARAAGITAQEGEALVREAIEMLAPTDVLPLPVRLAPRSGGGAARSTGSGDVRSTLEQRAGPRRAKGNPSAVRRSTVCLPPHAARPCSRSAAHAGV